MSRPGAITVHIGDQIIAMLREGVLPTCEIRARLTNAGAEPALAEHCVTCICTETPRAAFSRERFDIEQRVYPVLDRLARRGAVERIRYPHSREVYWRLVEAEESLLAIPQGGSDR